MDLLDPPGRQLGLQGAPIAKGRNGTRLGWQNPTVS